MARYEITDMRIALNLGTFEATSVEAALEQMSIEGGYDSLDQLCRCTGALPEHFDVLCVVRMEGGL